MARESFDEVRFDWAPPSRFDKGSQTQVLLTRLLLNFEM